NFNFAKQLSYGVTLAGVLQLIFLFFVTLKFYKPNLAFKLRIDSKVKFFFKKLLPSIFSSGITQINILIGTIIASFESGAISYLYYADRIYQINLAIAGIAVGTVSLPVLSKAFKNKNTKEMSNIQNKSLELSLLLSIPASFSLIIASEEIVSALFGYGSFSTDDVIKTADALKYFGYGVPAFALIKILSNFFFARDNTKIPFYISTIMVVINISISLSLFPIFGFIIIPIATSLATWIGVLFYIYLLNQKKSLLLNIKLMLNFLKILASTIIMSFILHLALSNYVDYLDYTFKFKAIYLLLIVGFTGIVYLLSCYLLGVLKIKNYKTN
ncbi:lipid II flippase MurJ, partial [Pelagibacteraceae bacterium]|nr:lipid II flippase MurJ [Pelagibacteraceae bacterium]